MRNLKKEAAENWKNTHLASEDAVTWLIVNADKRGNVQSLNCIVFKKYTPQVEGNATSHSNGHIKVVWLCKLVMPGNMQIGSHTGKQCDYITRSLEKTHKSCRNNVYCQRFLYDV